MSNSRFFSFLFPVASRIAPDIESLTPKEKSDFLERISAALSERPVKMQRQLSLFLAAIRWLPIFWRARPYDRLAEKDKDRFLARLQDSPLSLIRKGFWGIKTLVFFAYYGNPDRWGELNYHPSFQGNEKLSEASVRLRRTVLSAGDRGPCEGRPPEAENGPTLK